MITKSERGSAKFALCIQTGGSEDLELRKIYQVLPDDEARREGYVRVIDESGEDYLYPAEFFVPVRLPVAIAREFALPSGRSLQARAQRGRRG